MQKSIRFFIRILPVFLALVKPASHMEKPACMKNTSAAPSSTHRVLMPEYISIPPLFAAFSGNPKNERRACAQHLRSFWNGHMVAEEHSPVKTVYNENTLYNKRIFLSCV